MTSLNKLLLVLDQTLGFPNKIKSNVIQKGQSFDQRSGEHVFNIEYRVKVQPGMAPVKAADRSQAAPGVQAKVNPLPLMSEVVAMVKQPTTVELLRKAQVRARELIAKKAKPSAFHPRTNVVRK